MVGFSSFLTFLSSALLVAAYVLPAAEMKREPGYPLEKKEPSVRQTRHLRPVYENTKRDITLPDVGQVASFPPTGIPQPVRGPYGESRTGGTNEEIDRQNPDYVASPLSDNGLRILSYFFTISSGFAGVIPNLKWSFSLSHDRLLKGGWIREQTVTDLPTCTGSSIER
jgi:oxalate decarboxylase